MTTDFFGQFSILEITAKASLVLLAILAARLLLTRTSAATKHLVLALGLGAVLALPLAVVALPALDLPLLRQDTVGSAPARQQADRSAPRSVPLEVAMFDEVRQSEDATLPVVRTAGAAKTAPSALASLVSWIAWIPLLWAVGALLVGGRSLIGWLRMARIAADARPVDSPRIVAAAASCREKLGLRTWPRLLIGSSVRVPMLWGFVRPTLLLPAEAREWTDGRLGIVLLHELAHLRRADGLSLLLGRLTTAIYWFNPLAWIVDHNARRDCERACDDVVLECGARPSDYARHLLAIARGLPVARPEQAAALAILGRPHFEGRLRSILHPGLRRGIRRGAAAAALACVVLVLGVVSSAQLVANEPDEFGQSEFEKAYKLHSQDRFDEAIAMFEVAIENDYRPATSMYNIACGYARQGNAREAISWLERAMAADFDGDYLFKDSDLDPIRSDPAFRSMLERVATADDSGKLELVRDRFEETNLRYDALVRRDSENGDAWYEIGTSLLSLRDLDRAISSLDRAQELLAPRNQNALYNLACAYAVKGQSGPALDSLEQSVLAGFDSEERFENDSDLNSIRGMQRFEEIAALNRTLSLDRFHDGKHASWNTAIEEFTAFTNENPKVGRGWFDLGWALHSSARYAEAVDAFEKSAELGFLEATASYNAACGSAMSGETAAALAWLDRAVAAGFASAGHMASDEDLESLHGNPRFDRILEDMGWDAEQDVYIKAKKAYEVQLKSMKKKKHAEGSI